MKKTIPTSIANTLFYIEEDAYQDLDQYLKSIRAHFANTEDSDEIVRDIESRIAEQFIEYTDEAKSSGTRIVTKEHIERLIKSMGLPNDFEDDVEEPSKETSAPPEEPKKARRRLYRDPDNAILGGVAAGLSEFFGIDAVYIRLIFILSIFFGGSGLVVYIVLWLAMPEAITASQKLEMRGDPVTLETMSEVVKEKVEEVRARRHVFVRAALVPITIVQKVMNFIATHFFPLLGTIIGIIFNVIGSLALVTLTAILIILSLNLYPSPVDFPLHEVVSWPLYMLAIVAGFFTLAIPFMLLTMLGDFLRRKTSRYAPMFGAIFTGLWLISLVIGIVIVASVSEKWNEVLETDPRYQDTTVILSPEAFTAIEARDGQHITVVEGDTHSVTVKGMARDVARAQIESTEGVLSVTWNREEDNCLFCFHKGVEIEVTTPSIERIVAENGTYFEIENWDGDNLSFVAENASTISYSGSAAAVNAEIKNGSRIALSGTGTSLSATVENASRLRAMDFVVQTAEIRAENGSRAEVNAASKLSGRATNASRIVQYGPASESELIEDNGSRVDRARTASSTPEEFMTHDSSTPIELQSF